MRLNKRTRMGFKNYISPAHLLFIIHFDITRNSPFNMKTNQRQMQNKSNGLLLNIFVFVAKKEKDFDTCTSFPFNPPRPTLFWLQKTPNGNNEITIKWMKQFICKLTTNSFTQKRGTFEDKHSNKYLSQVVIIWKTERCLQEFSSK